MQSTRLNLNSSEATFEWFRHFFWAEHSECCNVRRKMVVELNCLYQRRSFWIMCCVNGAYSEKLKMR